MDSHQKTKAAKNTHPTLRNKEGEWAKSDAQMANVLAEHFANVFKLYNSEMPEEDEREILNALETPGQLITPIKKFKLSEVRSAIKQLRSKKKKKKNSQDMTLSREKS